MKRTALALVASLAVMLVAAASFAGPPLNGVYKSTDLGGVVNLGRYSEAWDAGGGGILPGTTLNAQSWDGTTLGTMWKYWCSTLVAAPVLLVNTVDANGNGQKTYMKTFVGGYLWLSGTGPWANGDVDYPGLIDTYYEFETIQYVNWVRVAAITNVQATGHFNNYPTTCMNFAIGNGSEVGSTDFGQVKPVTYPGLLDATTCYDTRVLGSWWDFFTLTLSITGCTTPTEDATWGSVKARYSE